MVEEYLGRFRTWQKSSRERFRQGVEKGKPPRELHESAPKPPDVKPAIAAATAILNLGGAHDKTIEAAEFLVMRAHSGRDSDQHMYVGAKALLAYAPDYQEWPQVLSRMSGARMFNGPAIDRFFEELASEAEDPVLRANGKYYLAAGLLSTVNSQFMLPTEDREAMRQRAIEAATGLSAGVEAEKFLGENPDGTPVPETLAKAEADLLRSLNHGTAGGTLPEVTGTRLDGVEERLSDYRGRIVLLDFWATVVQAVRSGATAASGDGGEAAGGAVRHRRDQRGRGTWDRDPVHRGRADALDELARRQGERLRASAANQGLSDLPAGRRARQDSGSGQRPDGPLHFPCRESGAPVGGSREHPGARRRDEIRRPSLDQSSRLTACACFVLVKRTYGFAIDQEGRIAGIHGVSTDQEGRIASIRWILEEIWGVVSRLLCTIPIRDDFPLP